MEPIRVLQVFTILNRGGAETNIMNYYRHIDRGKFHFDFVVHRPQEGVFEKEIKSLGGNIYRLPPVHPLLLKKYRKAVREFLNEHTGYDIIHGNTSELGFVIAEEASRLRIPVIIGHAHSRPRIIDQKTIFRNMWKRELRKHIHVPFTCSGEAAEWLFGKEMAAKAFQLNNAVSVEKFAFQPAKALEMKAKLNHTGALCFLHVGNFTAAKNHLFLLEVFAHIHLHKPESRLLLVGDGERRKIIENKIAQLGLEESVKLLGVRADVHELLQAADYFLFPSVFEGLPVSLVEAQASGIRCFISDGIPAEALLVKENVEVISLKKSAKEWAEIILQNLEYKRKDTSDIIREKGYDIKENVKKLEEKYEELVLLSR